MIAWECCGDCDYICTFVDSRLKPHIGHNIELSAEDYAMFKKHKPFKSCPFGEFGCDFILLSITPKRDLYESSDSVYTCSRCAKHSELKCRLYVEEVTSDSLEFDPDWTLCNHCMYGYDIKRFTSDILRMSE